ncbi:PAS domain S-box protein [Mucilaginibacter robiniae]|uniref:histidine kinase n=1 Tax=Mucilaginibacter robiniae TaxID=2728022 RepID=A0A7L5E197_9SPHI|nr:ATP-binding protein [Mucilaginibacter robiniae]QJD96157.1 PAS domain S-box protein [Mucilaginibacter robiniae]
MKAVAPMFEALFNQLTHPVAVLKADVPSFTIAAVNEQYKKSLRSTTNNLIGKAAFDVFKPWDSASEKQFDLLRNGLIQAITEKQQVDLPTINFESCVVDGVLAQASWWQIQITPVFSEDGQVDYLMCVNRNVTDQKEVSLLVENASQKEQELLEELQAVNEELASTNEELMATVDELNQSQENLSVLNNDLEQRIIERTAALAASERRYRSILNALPHIAWTSTPEGEINFFNQRWYDYTGMHIEQTLEKNWEDILHPDDLQTGLATYQNIIASQRPGEYEVRKKSINGEYRWHLLRIQPVRNEHGEIEHWVGTSTDIDAIKQLQQQKDDFISIASHELKTPITSLKASLQLIDKMKDNPSKEMLPKLILQSRKSIQRVSTLVEDLLNVNRLQHGEIHLNKTPFILSQLLNSICNPISIMGKQKIYITGNLELMICADEHRIDQVVTNLVNNAVKYAPESAITLNIQEEGSMVRLSVTDEGPGIPENKIPHLFDRYFRVDDAGYQASGLGLGLYISSEIIKRHDGEIGVQSELGKGSTFWFTVPIGAC